MSQKHTRECRYRDCPRAALPNHTTCAKHYTDGTNLAQERRKVKKK